LTTLIPRRILGSLALGLVCAGGLFTGISQAHAALSLIHVHADPTMNLGTTRIMPDLNGHPWTYSSGSCGSHASATSGTSRLHPPSPCANLNPSHGSARIMPDPKGPNW
jgi:hypothetical protein